MTPGAFEELFRNLSVPARRAGASGARERAFDVPAVMAEQARLGTLVVGPPMSVAEASRA